MVQVLEMLRVVLLEKRQVVLVVMVREVMEAEIVVMRVEVLVAVDLEMLLDRPVPRDSFHGVSCPEVNPPTVAACADPVPSSRLNTSTAAWTGATWIWGGKRSEARGATRALP